MTQPSANPRPLSESVGIQRELLQTDRLISVLGPKLNRSGNPKAQERFHEAVAREKEARSAFGQSLFARAARLTRESRSLAREAAVMVGPPEEDPTYVERTIEHAEDALSLAEDVLRGTEDPGVLKQYSGLKNDLAGARALYHDGAMRVAYARAVEVRDGVLGLLRDCERLPIPEDTASRALRKAEQALDTAGKELGPSPSAPASRWQREAAGQLFKARTAFARRDYRGALIYSKLVERNLEQALAAQRSPAATS